MQPINRRAFITRSGAVVAAAGAAVLTPSQLVGALTNIQKQQPEDAHVPVLGGDKRDLNEPIIAHVRNVQAGEIAVFAGSQEFMLNDPELAGRLARVWGGK